ncbi:MAG TPA: TMEM165/GDT1 family protein [Steroidobacteraceae bacterium]|nr:TMEM165/GDT1 family protein [Steroidobacteraceae bacterium]
MDLKTFALIFATIFLAELGDKTQLATLLYSTEVKHGRWNVFAAAALALVASTAIAVLAGSLVGRHVPVRYLHIAAGIAFIAIGAWTLLRA